MANVTITQLQNGTTADALAVDANFNTIATQLNGNIDSTNIAAGSVGNTQLAAAISPITRARDIVNSFVVSGYTIATSGTLTSTIIGGKAYINGAQVVITNTPITVTASKDTYVDILDTGAVMPSPVANGATSPAISTNSDGSKALRIATLISSATAITATVQIGQDTLGNNLYWRSPTILSFGTATVATSESTVTAFATDLTTVGPSVTVIVGPSGIVEVSLSSSLNQSTSGAYAFVGIDISGATTIGASTAKSITYQGLAGLNGSRASGAFSYTGLTPGTTTFKLKYGQASGGSAVYADRTISVKAL